MDDEIDLSCNDDLTENEDLSGKLKLMEEKYDQQTKIVEKLHWS